MAIDLHTHTTCSDGTLTPAGLVHLAHEKKLRAVAITDHDTVDANEEAQQTANKYNITVVPGVELSAGSDIPANGHMHLVGLFIDYKNAELTEQLEYLRRKRMERNEQILEKLSRLGHPLELDDLDITGEDHSVGRPHIARAMVEKGYVQSVRDAFLHYLKKGAPAYMDKEKLPDKEAIRLIHQSGGMAILAHPVSLGYQTPEQLSAKIRSLKQTGLDGIEIYSPLHDRKIRSVLRRIAADLDLQISGGSDYHGGSKPEIELGQGNIPYKVYLRLRESLDNQRESSTNYTN